MCLLFRKISFFFLFSSTVLFLSLSSAAQTSPKAVFESETLDAGSFSFSNPDYDFVFKYRNEGDSAFIISKIIPTCSCISVSFSSEPLMPGDSTSFVAHYHARHVGSFKQLLTVVNNSRRPLLRLRLIGKVTAPVSSEGQEEWSIILYRNSLLHPLL